MTVLNFLHSFHLLQPVFQHVQDSSSPVFSLCSAELQQIRFKKYFEYIPVSLRKKMVQKLSKQKCSQNGFLSKSYEIPSLIFLHASGKISSQKCKRRNIQDKYSSVHPSVSSSIHSCVCSTVRSTARSTIHSTVRSTICSSVRLLVGPSVQPSVHPSVCSSGCLSVRLFVHPDVCPSIRPSIRSSIQPSVCPSVCLSVRSSVCSSFRLTPFNHLFVRSLIRLWVHPSV